MKRYIKVMRDEQIQCCVANAVDVDLWLENELELTSRIVAFNETTIKFMEGNYLRKNVDLRVRGNYFRSI